MKKSEILAIAIVFFCLGSITYAATFSLTDDLISIENGETLTLQQDFEFTTFPNKPDRTTNHILKKGIYVAKAGNYKGAIFVGPEKCLVSEQVSTGEKWEQKCGIHRSTDGEKWHFVLVDVVFGKPSDEAIAATAGLAGALLAKALPPATSPYIVQFSIDHIGSEFGKIDPEQLAKTREIIDQLMIKERIRKSRLESSGSK